MPPRSKMPAVELVQADVDAMMTNEQIAEKYGVSKNVVSTYLSNHGIRRKPRTFVPALADIAACVHKGMTCKQISEELGGNPDTISRMIVRNGLRDQRPIEVVATETLRVPRPGPDKIVNGLGISLPRIPTIHGHFEVRT